MIISLRSATRHLPLILAGGLFCGQAAADASQRQALRWDQAECLRENAETYLKDNDFPALLFAGLCRKGMFNPTSKDLAEISSFNSALDPAGTPHLIAGPKVPLQASAAVLVLTRAQLLCLQSQFEMVATRDITKLSDGQQISVAVLDFSTCPL